MGRGGQDSQPVADIYFRVPSFPKRPPGTSYAFVLVHANNSVTTMEPCKSSGWLQIGPAHRWSALLLTVLALASPCWVLAADTPRELAGATVVGAEQARAMVDKGVAIVDTRVAHEYVEQHIKGAISVPYKEKSAKRPDFDPRLDKFDLTKLPADKAAPVIFYCNAGECWRSYKASKTAVAAGYARVYWLRGGIPEWKAKGFPVE